MAKKTMLFSGVKLSVPWLGYSALWSKKHFCAPCQQRLQSLKWKVGAIVRKKQKQSIYC